MRKHGDQRSPLGARLERAADFPLQDLPNRSPRQGLNLPNDGRHLLFGEVALEKATEVIDRSAWLENNRRSHGLPHHRVRYSDDSSFEDLGTLVENSLDLHRRDQLSVAPNRVCSAIEKMEISFFIKQAEVTHMCPAVCVDSSVSFWILMEGTRRGGTAKPDLSHCTWRKPFAGFVTNGNFRARPGTTQGSR